MRPRWILPLVLLALAVPAAAAAQNGEFDNPNWTALTAGSKHAARFAVAISLR